jgi:hypothetical protein
LLLRLRSSEQIPNLYDVFTEFRLAPQVDRVTWAREVDRDDLLDLSRRLREYDDAIRKRNGFFDSVRYEDDRLAGPFLHL